MIKMMSQKLYENFDKTNSNAVAFTDLERALDYETTKH